MHDFGNSYKGVTNASSLYIIYQYLVLTGPIDFGDKKIRTDITNIYGF
jgi:hypothetical protein